MKTRVLAIALVSTALAYLATGIHFVSPGDVLVVRRLGRVLPQPWAEGPHWGWPLGFDRATRVRVDEVRSFEIGLDRAPGPDESPDAGEFLTGDLNLVRARAIVQYRVADPIAFVLQAGDLDRLLARLAEASLSSAFARSEIDDALHAGRVSVARRVERDLGRLMSECKLGIAVLGVNLIEARPPAEVQPDFAAAQAAQSEYDRRLTEAKTYAALAEHNARAAAQAALDQAHARAQRSVELARSRAGRFLALLAEADRRRPLTVERIYRDALRDLLPRVKRKVVMAPEEPIDLSLFGLP
jgi:membrane protease subunit HflK